MSPEVGDTGLFGGDDGLGGYIPLAVAANDNGAAQLSWVHGNHMGVPAVYTDASGGEIGFPTGYSTPGFPGQSRTFADLYYNRYRDYDPTTGRYIQADPIGLAGGSSPYSYAMNNPLRYTDPTGEVPVPLVIGGAHAIKCVINPLCRAAVAAGATWFLAKVYDFNNDNPFNPVGNSCPSVLYKDFGSGGRSGGGAYSSPSNRRDNWCEVHQEADRAQCREAWQFLSTEGLIACNRSAFTRYSECLSRGGPHKITSPLFLPIKFTNNEILDEILFK